MFATILVLFGVAALLLAGWAALLAAVMPGGKKS